MSISLLPLPYPEEALEPHISKETLETHHGKHHKTYIDKLNAAISGTSLDEAPLEEIVAAAHKNDDKALFNNAAQSWNHGFYWHSLNPDRTQPSDRLAQAIDRDFGSLKELKQALTDEAVGHFASGWAWLVAEKSGKLAVISTHDAGTPITEGRVPLLTIDVWEHAYYIDVKNKRPDYVGAVVDHLLNWQFASENFDRGTVWSYSEAAMIRAG